MVTRLIAMLTLLPTAFVALYTLVVAASQTTVYQATAHEWTWTGAARRVARTTLRNVCPRILASDTDYAILSSSAADEIKLAFQGAQSVKVFGIIFSTCDSDPVVGTLEASTLPRPGATTATSACHAPAPARCDALLAEWDHLNAGNSDGITLSAHSAAFGATIAVFNATLFFDSTKSGGGGVTSKSSNGGIRTMTISSSTTTSHHSSSAGITPISDPSSEGTVTTTSSFPLASPTSLMSSGSESEGSGTPIPSMARPSTPASSSLITGPAFTASPTTLQSDSNSRDRARVVVPSIVLPLVFIAAVSFGAWWMLRRRGRSLESGISELKPYTEVFVQLHSPPRKARVNDKFGMQPVRPQPVRSAIQAVYTDDPPLEEIRQAMRRVGFTPGALLASLNHVYASGAVYAPSETRSPCAEPASPPQYVAQS